MTTNNQTLPSGYKPSPLGIIPEDWEVKRLGDVCTFHNGRAYSQKELLSSGKYRVLRVGNFFTNGSWYWSDMELEDDKYANNGDLLYAWSASFGPRFWEGEKIIYHYHIWKIDSFNEISKDFLYLFLLYDATKLTNTLQGGTMTHITKENMEKRSIAVPPLPEQQRIVSLLSLWDTAIAKQTALIEKLTLRKRGLMQQLLTGKKRLKGFEGKWKVVKLGEVALVIGGGTPNTNISDYWDGGIPWFTPSEIGENKYVNISERTISEKGLHDSSAKTLPKGTILFTSRATIGAKAILTTEATTNQGFQSLVVINGNNNEFIYYYLDIIINEIKQKASGSTFPEVSAESIRKTAIKIPNVNEQNAIASVLVNADKEIEMRKQKLASLQEQKKGLMQVLLTGKKRIKQNISL